MGIIKYKDIAYGGGGGGQARGGTDLPAASLGANGDYYYQYDQNGDVQIAYVKLDNTWHKLLGGDIIGGGEEFYINDLLKISKIIDTSEEDGGVKTGTIIEEE